MDNTVMNDTRVKLSGAFLLRPAVFLALMIGALFGPAGRWDLPFFWGCLGVYVAFMVIVFRTIDPGLLEERLRPGAGGKDRLLRWIVLPFILGHWIVAGLDVGRFHWSDSIPSSVQIAALSVFALSLGLNAWAMAVNRFFSPVVRIQEEREHRLVTTGPYRYVRHPGYIGGVVASLSGGLALGSWWAMLPIAVFVIIFIRRTLLEDRFLHEELEGYTDYAARVRYRWVPFIW